MKKLGTVLLHTVMLAIVCAIAAYWAIRILTPPPSAAPPPVAATPPRDPDPVLAARMFGLVQTAPSAVASNVQVGGVFAAGKDSAAILIVDGKPARVFLLGQDIAPGVKLVDVRPDGVSIEGAGGRQDLQIPLRQVASVSVGGPPPAPAYTLEGNTLSAPSQPGSAAPAPVRPGAPSFAPSAPAAQPMPAPPPNLPQIPATPPGVGAPAVADSPAQMQPPQAQPSPQQPSGQVPHPPRPPPSALKRGPATN